MSGLDLAQVEQIKKMGAYLRQEREQRSVPLEEIALKTYIPLRLLNALEQGEAEKLPQAIFVQGFVRRYADAIGMDGMALSKTFVVEPSVVPLAATPQAIRPLPPLPPPPVAPVVTPPPTAAIAEPQVELKSPAAPEPPAAPIPADFTRHLTDGSATPAIATPVDAAPVDAAPVDAVPVDAVPVNALEAQPSAGPDIASPLPILAPPAESTPHGSPAPGTSPVGETTAAAASVPLPSSTASDPITPLPSLKSSAYGTPSPQRVTSYLPFILLGVGASVFLVAIASFLTLKPQPSPVTTVSPSSAPIPTTPTPVGSPTASPGAGAPAPANVQVSMNLTGESWVSVVADGKLVFEGIQPQNFQKVWSAEKSLTIVSGNAGVVLLSSNQEPPKPMGKLGEVQEMRFPVTSPAASATPTP